MQSLQNSHVFVEVDPRKWLSRCLKQTAQHDASRHGTARHGTARHGTTSDFSTILTAIRPWTFRWWACLPIASRLVVTSQQGRTVRCRVKVLFASLPPLTAEPRPQSLLDLWCTKWHNYKLLVNVSLFVRCVRFIHCCNTAVKSAGNLE